MNDQWSGKTLSRALRANREAPRRSSNHRPSRASTVGLCTACGLAKPPRRRGQGLDCDGSQQLDPPDLVAHDLHLAAGVGHPALAAGVEEHLLLLQLEDEQVEQVTLPPENVRHLTQAHRLPLPATPSSAGGKRT